MQVVCMLAVYCALPVFVFSCKCDGRNVFYNVLKSIFIIFGAVMISYRNVNDLFFRVYIYPVGSCTFEAKLNVPCTLVCSLLFRYVFIGLSQYQISLWRYFLAIYQLFNGEIIISVESFINLVYCVFSPFMAKKSHFKFECKDKRESL